jgi:hypothetical protein
VDTDRQDTNILWESLAEQPEFTARSSNIGFGWWSHDIGGHHHGITDDDLMIRWTQLGTFSPILRLHSNWNQTIVREPWLRGFECKNVMTKFLQMRHRLIPYLYTMSVRATLQGRSLCEPMYYDHPTEDYAYRNPNEYLFGSEMIVAPITSPRIYSTNMGKVECWLPKGRYVDLLTGSVYDGDRVIVMHRNMSAIPVLSGAGSIIPIDKSPNLNTTNGAPIPTALEFIVTVGVDAEVTLMEDDGNGENVDHIKFSKTPVKYLQEPGQIILGPTDKPLLAERQWSIQLPAFPLDKIDQIKVRTVDKTLSHKIEQDEKAVTVILDEPVSSDEQVIITLGKDLRLRSNDMVAKIEELLRSAQIEHDTKWAILCIVRADLTRAVRVSRIEATPMCPDIKSALMEFILADA